MIQIHNIQAQKINNTRRDVYQYQLDVVRLIGGPLKNAQPGIFFITTRPVQTDKQTVTRNNFASETLLRIQK